MLAMPAAFCSKTLYVRARRKVQTRNRSDLSMSTSRALSADAAVADAIATAASASAAMGHAGHPHLQHGSAAGFDSTAAAPPGLNARLVAISGAHDPGPRRRARNQ